MAVIDRMCVSIESIMPLFIAPAIPRIAAIVRAVSLRAPSSDPASCAAPAVESATLVLVSFDRQAAIAAAPQNANLVRFRAVLVIVILQLACLCRTVAARWIVVAPCRLGESHERLL